MKKSFFCAPSIVLFAACFLILFSGCNESSPYYDPFPGIVVDESKDLISLHYDHAPDKDDGQSAAADRTMLDSIYGAEWLSSNVIAVSGAYGWLGWTFNDSSDAVMEAVWGPRGGWIDAHNDWNGAVDTIVDEWTVVLLNGGDIYVKEGGQSDITADVVRRIKLELPAVVTQERIHVVQHSVINEMLATQSDLLYVQENTQYILINDANAYLNIAGGDPDFESAAINHPVFGTSWQAAFDYYPIEERLDFSDSGELMAILGLGELTVVQFRTDFLE